jgi:hypothetical protein
VQNIFPYFDHVLLSIEDKVPAKFDAKEKKIGWSLYFKYLKTLEITFL